MRFKSPVFYGLKIKILGILVKFFVDPDQKVCDINSGSCMFVRLQELTTVRTIRVRTVGSATCTRTATSAPATMDREYTIEGYIVRVRSLNGQGIHYLGVHCDGQGILY